MRHYRKRDKLKVTRFAHRSKFRRPVAMKIVGGDDGNGASLGDLAEGTDKDTTDQMMQRLREAAEIIANYCRISASRYSVRIPDSLEVKNDSKSVYILGGGPAAPNAYPFDPPSNPPVWHPVFAEGPRKDWNWAPQPYRPFLEEGAEAGGDEAAEQFANIIDDWASEIGSDRP